MVANGLGYSDLDPAALACAATEADEARVVRLAVTNRELRKQGLEPLLLLLPPQQQHHEKDAADDTPQPTKKLQQRLGLSADEEATLRKLARMASSPPCVPVTMMMVKQQDDEDDDEAYARVVDAYFRHARGSFGTLMGLRLTQSAYYRFQRICESKVARRLCADHDASRQYLMRRLLGHLCIRPPKKGGAHSHNNDAIPAQQQHQ